MPPRIYADFNGFYRTSDRDFVEMDTQGTLRDLHFFQIQLQEGMTVQAWDFSDDVEDLELSGVCRFITRPHRSLWVIEAPLCALEYIPRRKNSISHPMLCFRCRFEIAKPNEYLQTLECPNCQLPVDFPWQSPTQPT